MLFKFFAVIWLGMQINNFKLCVLQNNATHESWSPRSYTYIFAWGLRCCLKMQPTIHSSTLLRFLYCLYFKAENVCTILVQIMHSQPCYYQKSDSKDTWHKKKATTSIKALANIQPILHKPSFVTYQALIVLMKPVMSQSPMPMKKINKQHRKRRNQKSKLPSNLSTYNWYIHSSIFCPNCAQVSDDLLPSGFVFDAVHSCRLHHRSCWELTPFCCQYVKHVWVLCHEGKSCHHAHGLLGQCVDLRTVLIFELMRESTEKYWALCEVVQDETFNNCGEINMHLNKEEDWPKISREDDQMTSWWQCSCFAIASTSKHPLFKSWLTELVKTCYC